MVLPSAYGQGWHGPHAVPFFRATEVQGLSLDAAGALRLL